MADNEEIIGGIGVSITGDYSSLAASYSTAQDQAQTAGEAIADAFNEGVSGVSDAADVVTESLSGIGPAGDGAAAGLDDFKESAGSAGEAAHEAESILASMAEQLTAIGEALVITEGLKEFGSEALNAADSITTASIALTKFTGDANETSETIEGLEALGMADGLSMPSLLTAAQRMTALLPEGTDVVAVLGEIADGAAVMGTDVGTAANAFDRIVASGSVSARQLVQIGQSLETLSTAFNVVTGGANSTADSVAAMMKSLDDQGRIAVLRQSLSNLGGTAQQVAEQTFGGQWQQLANAWESTMVQVGQALLPVISDLTAFAKADVLPFIHDLVSDFNSLPGPIKDVAVGIGLLTAATIPLTGLAAAAAIGLNGLAEAATRLGIISGETAIAEGGVALASEGVAAAAVESVPELGEQAIAIEAVGTAATEAALQYDLFAHSAITANWGAEAEQLDLFAGSEVAAGEGAAGMGASMGLAATGGVLVLAGAFGSLIGAYKAWKATSAQQVQQTATLMDTVNALSAALQKHGVEFQSLNDQYNNGQITLQELADKLQALDTEWQNSISVTQNAANNSTLLAGALKTLTDEVQKNATAYTNAEAVYGAVITSLQTQAPLYKSTAAGIDALMAAQEGLVSAASKTAAGMASSTVALTADALAAEKATFAYQAQSGAYQQVLSAYNAGAPVLGQLDAAYTKLQASEAAAAAAGAPVAGSLQAITEQANAAVNSTNVLATSQGIAADQAKAQSDALSDDDAQVLILSQKLDLLVTAQDQMAQKVAAGTAQYSQQLDIQKQVVTVSQQLIDAQNKAATAALNQGNAAAIAGGDVGVLKQELDAANLNLQQMTDKADAGTVSITAWAGAQKAAQTAAMNLSVAAAEDAADVGKATDSYSLAEAAAAGATAKLNFLTDAFHNNKAAITDVTSAQKAQLSAQIDADTEQNIAAAGLQNTTSSYGLLQVAVIEAQTKVDDLTKAQQSGQNVADQLRAANTALKSAQDALNGSTNSATSATDANIDAQIKLYGAMGNLSTPMGNVVTGLNNIGAAAGNATTQLSGVAAAVNSIANDMQNAFGSGSKSITGGGAGTTVQQTGLGFFGQAEYSTTSVPNITQKQLQAAVNLGPSKGGITMAQAVETENYYDSIGYSDDWTLTDPNAASSTSSAGAASTSTSTASTAPQSTGAASVAASSVPVETTSGAGTSAVDGGSYPAVTAHQASGEVWAVDTSGVSSSGSAGVASSISQQISTTINQSGTTDSSGAIAGAVSAIGGTVSQLTDISGMLSPITASLAAIAAAVTKGVSGGVVYVNGPGASQGAITGGGGTAAPSGAPSSYFGSGNPQGATVPGYNLPPASVPIASVPGFNPFSGGPTSASSPQISISIDARGSMGLNAQQMSQTIIAQVTQQLFTNGARITR